MPPTELVLADSPAGLDSALALLADLGTVGIDVERADSDNYWRAAALVQVGGEGRVALIDPLALPDLSALDAALAPKLCVLHAMENDLGPLAVLGIDPPELADTAAAAAVLGYPTGLETLLGALLGVELAADKAAMQRADWAARPLPAAMQEYAAGDVADLPALWHELAGRLEAAGRVEWYRQELAATRALPPTEQRRDWTRTKGAGRLEAAAKVRLQTLWEAREEVARRTDTAPSRIAGDRLLVDLATNPPAAVGELVRRGVRRQAVREFGGVLMGALATAQGQIEEHGVTPRVRTGRPSTEDDRDAADRLRTVRSERARAIGVDAGILCPSRTLLGAVVADPTTPDALRDGLDLQPWQWEQLGMLFCDALGIDGPDRPPPPPEPLPVPPFPAREPAPEQEPVP